MDPSKTRLHAFILNVVATCPPETPLIAIPAASLCATELERVGITAPVITIHELHRALLMLTKVPPLPPLPLPLFAASDTSQSTADA